MFFKNFKIYGYLNPIVLSMELINFKRTYNGDYLPVSYANVKRTFITNDIRIQHRIIGETASSENSIVDTFFGTT